MAVNLSTLAGAAWQFFDNNGVPLSGGLIYTYLAGTNTNAATYTSNTGLISHSNPIVLDSAGRVPGGEIWLSSLINYKFVVKTSLFVLIGTYDNIAVNSANNIYYNEGSIGAVTRTVTSKLQEIVSVQDFGGVGDGSTNDLSAIQLADTSDKSPITLPQGSYNMGSSYRPLKPYLGLGGKITQSGSTVFYKSYLDYGTFPYLYGERTFLPADYTVIPTANYTYVNDSNQLKFNWINQTGYQKLIAGVYDGTGPRTQTNQAYNTGIHSGFGDGYLTFNGMSVAKHPDSNLNNIWSAQNSGGLYNGQIAASSDRVNLYASGDVDLLDNGNAQVAMFGNVLLLFREGNDDASYAVPRVGSLISSLGSKDIDAPYVASGKFYSGLDLSSGTFSSTAAITLAAFQNIAWAATPVVTSTGKFSTQNIGNTTTGFNGSYLQTTVAGAEVIGLHQTFIDAVVSVYPRTDATIDVGASSLRWNNVYGKSLRPGAGGVIWTSGAGSPESAVTAVVGSMYTRTDGGAGTTLYVKETGVGNTGWVAK